MTAKTTYFMRKRVGGCVGTVSNMGPPPAQPSLSIHQPLTGRERRDPLRRFRSNVFSADSPYDESDRPLRPERAQCPLCIGLKPLRSRCGASDDLRLATERLGSYRNNR